MRYGVIPPLPCNDLLCHDAVYSMSPEAYVSAVFQYYACVIYGKRLQKRCTE